MTKKEELERQREVQQAVSDWLRSAYHEIILEPLPDRIHQLLEMIEEAPQLARPDGLAGATDRKTRH